MDKTKKMVAFGVGIVAIGGIAWYMMKKEKAAGKYAGQDGMIGGSDLELYYLMKQGVQQQNNPSQLPPINSQNYNMDIGIFNGKGMGEYKWFGVKSSDRKKFGASSQIGTQAMINGTMPCTFSDFFLDANGKKGSFRCQEVADGTYDIPNGSRMEY